MTNATISVATAQGWKQMPVMHKNGALQVVQAPLVTLDGTGTEYVFYNTVHDNGLKLPKTDTDVLSDAIRICDWCAQNFPKFAQEDLNIANVPKSKTEEFNDQLWKFRFEVFRGWEEDCEPSPETFAINKVLEPLGFSHGGDFYPVEFDCDSYKWIEIGCSAIAYTDTYVAVLNYSIMEYWEADHNNSGLVELTEKAVRGLEKVDG